MFAAPNILGAETGVVEAGVVLGAKRFEAPPAGVEVPPILKGEDAAGALDAA